jgi:hypothetical protein
MPKKKKNKDEDEGGEIRERWKGRRKKRRDGREGDRRKKVRRRKSRRRRFPDWFSATGKTQGKRMANQSKFLGIKTPPIHRAC